MSAVTILAIAAAALVPASVSMAQHGPAYPQPAGNPAGWLTNEDYPKAARRAHVQGITGFTVDIDTGGRVVGCSVTSSSGSALLDTKTCELLRRRARFSPARDASGIAIPSTWSNRFRWQLPNG